MDDLDGIVKVIGGLIFGAIWLFSNFFKGKFDQDDSPTLPRSRPAQSPEQAAAAERQRQIQAEIRRKIIERQQGRRAPEDSPTPSRSRPTPSVAVPRQQQVPDLRGRGHAPTASRSRDAASGPSYEDQMRARMEQLEETKRRAAALQRQAEAAVPDPVAPSSRQVASVADSSAGGASRSSARRGLSGPVRSVLRDAGAARAAFIYGEVLGKPVGLRGAGSGVER